jgi:Amt family ammonium transporter
MFAIITPALITGAFAERTRFGGTMVFLILWTAVVYLPMAHMVWGHGGLLSATLGGKFPTLDFAGGSVVHITAGVSALVCALYLGKRVGYPSKAMPPHNLVYALIGAVMLWVGWFGFNAGSAVAAGSLATSAFVATHFGAASGAVGWLVAERIKNGRASSLGGMSGAVAGLATITPASGFVGPFSAFAIGGTAGVLCFLMVARVKARLGYDDSLDVFGVHGVGGTIGVILCGVFASSTVNPIFKDASGKVLAVGLIDGNLAQVGNQMVAVLIAVVLSVVGSLVCLKVADKTVGLRLSQEHEEHGLDLSQHGEQAYHPH